MLKQAPLEEKSKGSLERKQAVQHAKEVLGEDGNFKQKSMGHDHTENQMPNT